MSENTNIHYQLLASHRFDKGNQIIDKIKYGNTFMGSGVTFLSLENHIFPLSQNGIFPDGTSLLDLCFFDCKDMNNLFSFQVSVKNNHPIKKSKLDPESSTGSNKVDTLLVDKVKKLKSSHVTEDRSGDKSNLLVSNKPSASPRALQDILQNTQVTSN